ncbi:hypothetical protein R8556_21990 [Klebsiella pneumoniae]|uniref:hypothetical protein n=1 Tax=Klebsiella pneumoniae TaxID=573 RepID=UPI0029CAC066|nr:hypothetical protein [Klebsiella pneumoniae]WPI36486.1 hypothetical protein R8556_21990 [Klebsiella pneumoniae]WPI41508.1 hypothetical protein R8538_19165 [Klebsiella pneumoniae]
MLSVLFVVRVYFLAVFVYCRASPLPDCCRPYTVMYAYYATLACYLHKNRYLHDEIGMIIVSYRLRKATTFDVFLAWGLIISTVAGDYSFWALSVYVLLCGFEIRQEI